MVVVVVVTGGGSSCDSDEGFEQVKASRESLQLGYMQAVKVVVEPKNCSKKKRKKCDHHVSRFWFV